MLILLLQGTKGHISTYISRKNAMKRLMINLTDFRYFWTDLIFFPV